jgi:hypothetical protein
VVGQARTYLFGRHAFQTGCQAVHNEVQTDFQAVHVTLIDHPKLAAVASEENKLSLIKGVDEFGAALRTAPQVGQLGFSRLLSAHGPAYHLPHGRILFHPAGYKGGASALVQNFTEGRYVGVPLLQAYGMTIEPRRAASLGVAAYPYMLRWLR